MNNPINKADRDGKAPGEHFSTIEQAAIDAAKFMYKLGTFEKTYEYAATIYKVSRYEVTMVRQFVSSGSGKIYLFNRFKKKMVYNIVVKRVTYYTYTYPITYRRKDFALPPFHISAVAMIHTHPYVKGYGYNQFSDPDKLYARVMGLPFYLYTATGRLLVYSPSNGSVREICSNLEKDPHMP